MLLGHIYLACVGWYISVGDAFMIIVDIFCCTLFGTLLAGVVESFIKNQGGLAAVSTTDDISHAPTTPLIILSSTSNPSGIAELKLSRYTFRKNVTNSTKRISGVISEIKKVNLSLK